MREVLAFGNTVPTGIDVAGRKIFLGEAGPVPHRPETGRVVSFTHRARSAHTVVSGVRMVVDVEFGPHHELYALSQGVWDLPDFPENAGLPASPTPAACSGWTGRARSPRSSRGSTDPLPSS